MVVLLPRRRARGAARVRHGRAARAPPHRAPAASPRSAGWSSRSLIFLAFNAGGSSAQRLGRRDVHGHRVRARDPRAGRAGLSRGCASSCSRSCVVDDLVALLRDRDRLHASTSSLGSLAVAVGALRRCCSSLRCGRSYARLPVYACSGVGVWVALYESGDRPGRRRPRGRAARSSAYPPARDDLEQATDARATFREQPTARARARRPSAASRRRSRRTSGSRTGSTRGRAT